MDEKVIKDHKLIIKSVKLNDKPTKNGGKMYNVSMEVPEAGIEMQAVTFSDTIAAELEKFLDKEVPLKMSEREWQGSKSYTIVEANGIKNSGFVKGKGFQQDVVGLERRAAAEYATQIYVEERKEGSDSVELKEWSKIANHIYKWISERPVKPSVEVTGGELLSKDDLKDIPF